MFGFGASELIGQNAKLHMPDTYRVEHDSYLANYLSSGVKKIIGIGREVTGRRKDGATFPILLAVSVSDHRGKSKLAPVSSLPLAARRSLVPWRTQLSQPGSGDQPVYRTVPSWAA